ncbi:MAG TPA: DNA translocase FtsK 4TM domain-containing protein, partial [Candidatus Methylomirabilis sp.]|nr:DNA translocase FtsK 4TM domain-containing protein [Candidatus Methylomirabilis sp.]
MARRKKFNPFDYVPEMEMSSETKKSLLIVFIVLLGLLGLMGLFDLAGSFGQFLARGETLAFGWGKWFFPILLFWWSYLLYKKDRAYFRGAGILGIFLGFLSLQALLQIFLPAAEWRQAIDQGYGGGYLGLFFASSLIKILGFWGSLAVLLALAITSLMLIFNTSLLKLLGGESFLAALASPFKALFVRLFKGREEEEEIELAEQKEKENLFTSKSIVEETAYAEASAVEGSAVKNEEEEEAAEKPARKITEKEIWKTKQVKIDLPLDLLDSNSSKPTSGDIKNNSLIIQRT